MQTGHPYTKFVRRLESIVELSSEDIRLLSEMPTSVRSYDTDQDVVREGDTPTQCCLLLDGFLARNKIAKGSTRQIVSFHVPGDIPDLHSLHLGRMDHNLTSLGPTVVAFIPHSYFHKVLPRSQQLTHALWRETLVDAAIFVNGWSTLEPASQARLSSFATFRGVAAIRSFSERSGHHRRLQNWM